MIVIEPAAIDRMNIHAIVLFPDECCGFLFGTEEENGTRTISTVREVKNAKTGDKRRRFEISPKDYLEAEQFALDNGLLLLGIYHSHPNHPAIPSEHDRAAAQPYFSYVILSVMQGKAGQMRSWRLNGESQFEEEKFSHIHLNQSIKWQQ
jgi:proteasome lid subunit RPN8/RPN11